METLIALNLRPQTEQRNAIQDLLDVRLAQAMAAGTIVDVQTLAAAEAAAGLWERAMAGGRSDRLTASQLGMIGRALLTRGESVWFVNGRTPVVAADWDVRTQGGRVTDWVYRLTLAAPDGSATLTVPAGEVLHFRIRQTDKQPWRGRSPWAVCSETAKLAPHLERSLRYEEAGPVGTVLPVPNLDRSQGIIDALPTLQGKTVLGETMRQGWEQGESQRAANTRDWQTVRVGPDPPVVQVELRQDVERSLLAAAGVPVELVTIGSGADTREAWRRFLFATIHPVGKIVGDEVQRVLGGSGRIDWSDLAASDLQARARAYKGLREAGMGDQEARRVCGFE